MNIIHTNMLLVLFSKLLILNKKKLQEKYNHHLYMASFADAFSAVFQHFLNMRPVWKIWNIPILNKISAVFDNIEIFQACRDFS